MSSKMKRMVLYALMLLIVLFSAVDTAKADLWLPNALTRLDDEAFIGDGHIEGTVDLPDGVNTLGAEVFKGTRIYALCVPAVTDHIPAQGLESVAYIWLEGADTTADAGAFEGVRYVIAPGGSAAQSQAQIDGAAFVCSQDVVEQDGFLYVLEGESATLLCAQDATEVSGEVYIPARLKDGTRVTALSGTAMMHCGGITELYLPSGVDMEAGALDGCERASVSYYGEGEFIVTSIRADVSETSVNRDVTWIAQTNSEGPVTYAFELFHQADEQAPVSLQSKRIAADSLLSEGNRFVARLSEPGRYVLRVTCRNEAGEEASAEAEAVEVLAPALRLTAVTADRDAAVEGAAIVWTCEKSGGSGQVLYTYHLKKDGKTVDSLESMECSYTLQDASAGEYVLEVQASDAHGDAYVLTAAAVKVYTQMEAAPSAPVWTDAIFGENEDNAPVIEAGNISLAWEPVEHAAQYGVTVELYEKGAYVLKEHTAVSGTKNGCTISAQLFDGLTENTLCRIGLYSRNFETGQTRYYYAAIKPREIDQSMLVNGKSSLIWYEAYYEGCMRVFNVTSELPWTVTASEEGDWYRVEQQDDQLIVRLENNDVGSYQEVELNLDNGVNTAVISIRHYAFTDAPKLLETTGTGSMEEPVEYTMDPFAPNIGENAKNTYIKLYECVTDGTQKQVYGASSAGNIVPREIGVKENTLYRMQLIGYVNVGGIDYVNCDRLTSDWYVIFKSVTPFVNFGGLSEHTITMDTYRGVRVTYGGGELALESDVDWLTLSMENENTMLAIDALENTTGSMRVGHVTAKCASASAVLTVCQQSTVPVLLAPEGISQSESSPTKLYISSSEVRKDRFFGACDNITLYEKSGSSYVEQASGDDIVNVRTDKLKTGVTYRITLKKGSITRDYYVTFVSTSSYIILDDLYSTVDKTIPGAGGTATVSLQSSGTWTASSNADWLTLSVKSGSASTSGTTITLTAAANATSQMRQGTITFQRGSDQKCTVLVTQYPQNPVSNATWDDNDADSIIVDGDAGYERLFIDTNGEWTVSVTADWMFCNKGHTAKAASGTGADYQSIFFTELPMGSAARTGTVTFRCGSKTLTLQITQLPLPNTVVTASQKLSSTKTDPAIIEHEDLTVTWTGDPNVTYYYLKGYLKNENGTHYPEFYIVNDGSTSYSVTIPKHWVMADTSTVFRLELSSYDLGGVSKQTFYYQVVSGEGVFINNKTRATIRNMSDLGDTDYAVITSTGAWTAQPVDRWIHLDKTSGVSGDEVAVSVDRNFGDEREGTVVFECGGRTAVLYVRQWRFIPDAPSLTNGFSENIQAPTLLPAQTDSLTVNWIEEDQANEYRLSLHQVHSTSGQSYRHSNKSDGKVITARELDPELEECTLTGLQLKPGALYMLEFRRDSIDSRDNRTRYYLMAQPQESPYVYVQGDASYREEFGCEEDATAFSIESNAVWSAEVSDDWLMVGDVSYEWSDLVEEELLPGDRGVFTSEYDRLVVSALANDTGVTRTGTVTVKVPGASAEITVVQMRSCTASTLRSPALTDDRNNPVRLPYQDLNLSWNASPDGTGKYTVTLREKLPDETRYYDVYEKTLNATSLTIPVSKLTENADYMLYLDTWADDTYTVRKAYRFHAGFQNALSVYADVDWTDERVSVEAHASGGSGSGYEYSFGLRHNGALIDNTMWHDALNRFEFRLSGEGMYQVEVVVSDSLGQRETFIVSEHTVGAQKAQAYIGLSQTSWQPNQMGGQITLTVSASGVWNAVSSADWLIAGTDESNSSIITLTAMANPSAQGRMGEVTFACADATATIAVVQAGAAGEEESATVSLSQTEWRITADSADYLSVDLTSDGEWTVTEYPGWVSVSALYGTGDERIILYAFPNSGLSREGKIVFKAGASTAVMTVTQLGSDAPPEVTSITMSHNTVSTGVEVTFTVDTTDATSVILVVDGVRYENYALTDGDGSFTRAFSSSGVRSVQLIPVRYLTEGPISETKTLHVTSKGALASVQIHKIEPVYPGQDSLVSWTAVPNAQSYTMYLYCGTTALWMDTVDAAQTSCVIPARILPSAGNYTFVLMATAPGYTQSQSSAFVSVVKPTVNFNITAPASYAPFVLTDMLDIHINNPSGYHIAVKITDKDGNVTYLPKDNGTCSDPVIEHTLYYQPLTTGRHTIQAMAWPTAVRTDDSNAWYDTRRNVVLNIDGPLAVKLDVGGYTKDECADVTKLTSISLETNSMAQKARFELDGQPLKLYVNGKEKSELTESTTVNGYNRLFTCSIDQPTVGYHTFTAIVTDDAGRTHRRKIDLIAYTPVTNEYRYPNELGCWLRPEPDSPDSESVKLSLAARMLLLGQFPDQGEGKLAYVICGEFDGFVPLSKLSPERQYGLENLTITPLYPEEWKTWADSVYPVGIYWDCSIELPSTACFVVKYKPKGAADSAYVTAYRGREKNVLIAADALNRGTYTVRISVEQNKIEYAHVVIEDGVKVYGEFGDSTTLPSKATIEARSKDFLKFEEDLNLSDEMKANWAGYTWGVLFGDREAALANDETKATYITIMLMDSLARKQPEPSALSAQTFVELFEFCGNYEMFVEFWPDLFKGMRAVVQGKAVPDGIKHFFNSDGTIGVNGLLNHFCKFELPKGAKGLVKAGKWDMLKAGTQFYQLLVDAITTWGRYKAIPKAEIRAMADALEKSTDPVLRKVAVHMRKMENIEARGMFVAQYSLSDFLNINVDLAVNLGMQFVPLKNGITLGKLASEGLFNVTDLVSTMMRGKWSIDAFLAYRGEYDRAKATFLDNPIYSNYIAYAKAMQVYSQLMFDGYKGLIAFHEAYDDSAVGKGDARAVRQVYLNAISAYVDLKIEMEAYYTTYYESSGKAPFDW